MIKKLIEVLYGLFLVTNIAIIWILYNNTNLSYLTIISVPASYLMVIAISDFFVNTRKSNLAYIAFLLAAVFLLLGLYIYFEHFSSYSLLFLIAIICSMVGLIWIIVSRYNGTLWSILTGINYLIISGYYFYVFGLTDNLLVPTKSSSPNETTNESIKQLTDLISLIDSNEIFLIRDSTNTELPIRIKSEIIKSIHLLKISDTLNKDNENTLDKIDSLVKESINRPIKEAELNYIDSLMNSIIYR